MAEVKVGRRRQRKLAAAANPPEVLNLPQGFDELSPEEHGVYADMENDNATDKPTERAVPAKAPASEKTIFVFSKAQRTRNERANIRNWQLNNILNTIGDTRSEILFLLAVQHKDKKTMKDLKRTRARHEELLEKAEQKAEDVIAVGGVPITIPDWILTLPVLMD